LSYRGKPAPLGALMSMIDRLHRMVAKPGGSSRSALFFGFALVVLAALPAAAAKPARGAAPPPAVTVARIAARNVAPVYGYIGRVIAIHSVNVVPRVTAFIEDVPVRQGTQVKAGQVLFQLQKAQYLAALQSAQAQLAHDQAVLGGARGDLARYQQLAKENSIAKQQAADQAFLVQQDEATVKLDEANVDNAKLNLSYTTITSPIAGQIGAVTLTRGNLVTPTTPALATINQLDPIRVVFSVSYLMSAQDKAGLWPANAADLAVRLKLPNGSLYNSAGKIAFFDNQVSAQTGTVSIYADFPNPHHVLLPGTLVTVEVHRAKARERPLVPVEAVQTNQSGSFVLMVGPDNKVEERPVTLGSQIGQDFIVEKGLAGGERVIISGVQKVKPGETVNPVEAPAAQAALAKSGTPGPTVASDPDN
jgi:membrane fusion protein (multidrug efflux system)